MLSYCCTAVLIYVRKVIRMTAESSLRSELTISSYFLSSCLGVRVLGSKPNQSSRPGNSNTDSSHHVVLQAFVYKIAKPREPTNILEYQNIIPTQKWKSSASNQQSLSPIVRSDKESTKSYAMQRQEINEVVYYASAINKQIHMIPSVMKSTKSFDGAARNQRSYCTRAWRA